MLINDECSSWYNKVGDFIYQFVTRRKKSYMAMDQYSRSIKTTPLLSARSTVQSGMMVECK